MREKISPRLLQSVRRIICMPVSNFTLCLLESKTESCSVPAVSETPEMPIAPWALNGSLASLALEVGPDIFCPE